MARHKGRPAGRGKESGTGIPSIIKPGKEKSDNELTEKYTKDDNEISEQVHTRHKNRNVDKLHSTNAGGYKNR